MKRLLESIQVLDLSRLIPGGQCTLMLADLGAKVLKIEEPESGDYMRKINPLVYETVNRNKQSMTLNLKHPKGREIFLELIPGYDVLLETFRPGVMKRLGLDFETVHSIHPGMVYCSLSGYGQEGPYSLQSGHDLNYLSMAGFMGLTANRNEPPVSPPVPVADLVGGVLASHAILAALTARSTTGEGCYIDAALMDSALFLTAIRLTVGLATGKTSREDFKREGAYDIYKTRDHRYLALGVIEDKFWRNLARAIEREELAQEERFATDGSRFLHRKEIKEVLASVLIQRDLRDWLALFEKEDVPAAPVNYLEEVPVDPQIKTRGLLFDLRSSDGKPSRQVDYPVLFPGQETVKNQPAPTMGRDTIGVLKDLGYTEDELSALRGEGVI